jgi:acyl-CoA synthetase (AMP-forming)/AMP-acid ligase II
MFAESSVVADHKRVFTSPLPAPAVEPPPVTAALRHAASDPRCLAIVDGLTSERLSRGELASRSASVAAGLTESGVGRGDLVAFSLPNSAWWPVLALGVWRAGAALLPLSPLWTLDEIARVLARAQPRVVLDHESQVAAFATLAARDGRDPYAEPQLASTDLAAVLFSSGTGGLPKGVRLTHGNLAAGAAQLEQAFGCAGAFGAGSVALAGAPFFHAMGLKLALCTPLTAGAQLVTMPQADADRTLELAERHHVTHATLRPPVLAEIATGKHAERRGTSRLELVLTGGAHLPASVARRAGERLGCVVRQGYGMTEALISGPMGRVSDPATAGWLGAGTEARLVDPATGLDVPEGEPGELWVRGPQVSDGYHEEPEATAEAITPDGWLRTGDLVSIREDGQLVVEDRPKELIKVDGSSVAPAELELVLREHPSVHDAAVVGRPDRRRGEVPVAYVILAGDATTEQLRSYVSTRVAEYKRLHEIRVAEELPRLPSGKLLRRVLRDRERDRLRAPRRSVLRRRGLVGQHLGDGR